MCLCVCGGGGIMCGPWGWLLIGACVKVINDNFDTDPVGQRCFIWYRSIRTVTMFSILVCGSGPHWQHIYWMVLFVNFHNFFYFKSEKFTFENFQCISITATIWAIHFSPFSALHQHPVLHTTTAILGCGFWKFTVLSRLAHLSITKQEKFGIHKL